MNSPFRSEERFLTSFDREQLYVKSVSNCAETQVKHRLLIVHGLGGDTEAYQKLIELILKELPRCRCFIYDARGHGNSTRRLPVSVPDLLTVYVKDLAEVVRGLGLKRYILVGQSLGAVVCQTYRQQSQYPQPQKMILISAPVRLLWPLFPQLWFRLYTWRSRIWPAQATKRSYADHLRYKGSWDYSPRRIWSDCRYTGGLDYFLIWLSMFGWKSVHPKELNTSHLLYIYSAYDQLVSPRAQRACLSYWPEAKSVMVASNHNSIMNNPELVVPPLVDFLT